MESYLRVKLPEEVERCQLQMKLVQDGAWLFRMEDMVNDFSAWNRAIVKRLGLTTEVEEYLERQWRMQPVSRHVRDSSAQQYLKLNHTIRSDMWDALSFALREWYPEHSL